MPTADKRNHAKAFLARAEEYLASAEDSLAAERHTPASGNAIHAGICAKDAIVTALTGTTNRGKHHAAAASELREALGQRERATTAEKALRELVAAKSAVEYGTALVTGAKAQPLVRRARLLVELAVEIVRLGQ